MKCAIAIFAKAPVRGAVKTRLCPPLSPDQATELYRAFLLDTMHVISEIDGVEPGVLFTSGVGEAGSLVPSVGAREDFRAMAPSHFFLVPQRGDGFGVRLANGFRDLFAEGFDAVAIMDADSPTLPRAHITRLFEQLAEPGCDVSVGPCDDGGYWAIGMKRLHLEVLSDISWSTELVLAETLQHAQAAQLHAQCAPTWYDVDTGEALARLRRELTTGVPLAPARTIRALGLLPAGMTPPPQPLVSSTSQAEPGAEHRAGKISTEPSSAKTTGQAGGMQAAADHSTAGESHVR